MERLLEIIDTLLAPGGCPWDQKQTIETLRASLHEEAHEVLDAIDSGDDEHLCEEIGDLLCNLAFLCRVAEKEKRFTLTDAFDSINQKLIRRHPHVFGNVKLETESEVLDQWERIKQEERKGEDKHPLDRIPRTLPALSRAAEVQKICTQPPEPTDAEQRLGKRLWDLVTEARSQGLDPELALRRYISCCETEHRGIL
jgi:nucleoside triphosphate diphosphatase